MLTVAMGPHETAGRRRILGLAAALAAFLCFYAVLLGPAWLFDLANFSMGTARFHPELRPWLAAQLAAMIGVCLVLELICRRLLLTPLWARLAPFTALVDANLVYLGFAGTAWFWYAPPVDLLACHHDLMRIFAAGLGASFLYIRFRSLLPGAVYAALLGFVPLALLSSAEGDAPSMFYYVPADPLFGVLEAAAPPLSALLLLGICWPAVRHWLLLKDGIQARIFAEILFWLGGYTLIIKFAVPVAYSVTAGEPWNAHVMWDFWWAIHWLLGWWLWHGRNGAWRLAVAVTVAEIAIICVKFGLFFYRPEPDYWHLSWFVNKIAVLSCFLAMAAWLARQKAEKPIATRI